MQLQVVSRVAKSYSKFSLFMEWKMGEKVDKGVPPEQNFGVQTSASAPKLILGLDNLNFFFWIFGLRDPSPPCHQTLPLYSYMILYGYNYDERHTKIDLFEVKKIGKFCSSKSCKISSIPTTVIYLV